MNKNLEQIHGIIPPMITPFTEDGSLYEEGLRNLCRFLVERVQGLFICGSYGSGPLMTVEERKRVAKIVVEEVKNRIPIIVHVGAIDTRSTLELAEDANSLKVDAIAAVPPYYYQYNEEQLLKYYEKLVKSSLLPVIAYNNPKTCGFTMTPKFIRRLSEIGVAGIKDSSHDIGFFYKIFRENKDRGFLCLAGSIAMCLPSMVIGAPAVISGLGNVFPEIETKLYDACKQGDWERAAQLQQYVDSVKDITRIDTNISVTHAILKMRGVDCGVPRLPHQPLDPGKYNLLESQLKQAGVLD